MKSARFEKPFRNAKNIIALFVFSAALCACKKEEPQSFVMPPAPVVLFKAESKDSFRFIDTLGTASSFKSVSIVPQVSGQIISINFKQGDIVKEGDILVVIDKRPYEAHVLSAKAQLVQAQAKLRIDELAVERNKKLAESEFIDKQTFDTMLATVDSDRGAVDAAKAALDLAKINLDWCTVKAPISGKVGLFNIDNGNIVAAGTSMITTIEQLDRLYVDFIIPTQKHSDVRALMEKRGGKLELEVAYLESGFEDKVRKATVSIFENKNRYQSSTLVLRGHVENNDSLFWPDQAVKVRLNMEEVKGGVFIPDSAIQTDLVGNFVYIADKFDDVLFKIRKVSVKPIQLFPKGLYLVEGVKKDELVVVGGQLKIAPDSLAFSTDPHGRPYDAEGNLIQNPQQVQAFMGDIMGRKAKYDAQAKAEAMAAMQAGAKPSVAEKAPAKK